MTDAYRNELKLARNALARRDFDAAFAHLERAHILSQRNTLQHACVHGLMLAAGLRSGDVREAIGQVPRMLASLLFSRIWVPEGNTGRARVSAFQPMPIPEDLRRFLQ